MLEFWLIVHMVSLHPLDMIRPLQWEGFRNVNFQTREECHNRLYQEFEKLGGKLLNDKQVPSNIQWKIGNSTFACSEFEFDLNEISAYKMD